VNYFEKPIFASDCSTIQSLDENNLMTKFVYLLLHGKQDEIYKFQIGMGQPHVYPKDLKKFQSPLPPLEVQEKIVAELDGYQKIIDGAKQVVENYKPTIKIDPDWPLVELGELCSMEYGYTAKAQESGDTRFVRITDIDDNVCLISDNPMFIDLSEESKPYLLEKGDVLIARTGATYGKTLLFNDNEQGVFASYLIRLNFNHDKVMPAFFTSFSLGEIYWQQARELVSGGGQPQFNANVIKRIRMPIPPLKTQQKLVAEIESECELVEANKKLIEVFEKKIKYKIGEVWGE
jgi:restriction endonuclease S subunit